MNNDIVEISSILQRQKIPEGIRINFENLSSPTGNSKIFKKIEGEPIGIFEKFSKK